MKQAVGLARMERLIWRSVGVLVLAAVFFFFGFFAAGGELEGGSEATIGATEVGELHCAEDEVIAFGGEFVEGQGLELVCVHFEVLHESLGH